MKTTQNAAQQGANIIEKQHNAVLTEVFTSKSAYDKHESECAEYAPQFENLIEMLKQKAVAFVRGKFGSFGPHLQYIRLDMVAAKDWVNSISDNSVYIDFQINMQDKTIEASRCGHIWLTDEDRKKSYLCMCSVKQAHTAQGGKWMRKSKYKTLEDAAAKMVKFYNDIYMNIDAATGGYPFKQMQINIY